MSIKFQYPKMAIADTVEIGSEKMYTKSLPEGLRILDDVGLAGVEALDGAVLYRAVDYAYEVRATITPGGDYLAMFPAGQHYGMSDRKANTMIALRSSDKGKTWSNPYIAFNIDYNQHGFIPLIPKGSKRIYSFGTQPVWGLYTRENGQCENAPIGYLYSDDDGYTWKGPTIINPVNDPGFLGISVTRMCETNKGTWLLGTNEGTNDPQPTVVTQYILRSEDQGKTWELLPDRRSNGWQIKSYRRQDEGRAIQVGDRVLFMQRTPEGRLWAMWSDDDGKTWSEVKPTSLINPDAPPMLTHLSDGKTLVCLHHNRHHDINYKGLSMDNASLMGDRSEIWAAMSTDCGQTWSEPGFLYCNALKPDEDRLPFYNHQCSYNDMFVDEGVLNIFIPHRWRHILHLQIMEDELFKLPKKQDLF